MNSQAKNIRRRKQKKSMQVENDMMCLQKKWSSSYRFCYGIIDKLIYCIYCKNERKHYEKKLANERKHMMGRNLVTV